MIELHDDSLVFTFPQVHEHARLSIDLQRTLRIPDDGATYSLPPGLGRFPLRHVDDFADRVPPTWVRRGGVMTALYQAEALWILFHCGHVRQHAVSYPFAIKVAAGKIDAITGEPWSDGIHRRPQDYAVAPKQPWLDGFCVERGTIRQFVAMPLGGGYSAEEQLTGQAEHGGLQIVVYPMKREAFERRFPVRPEPRFLGLGSERSRSLGSAPCSLDMGLAPGGRMRQEIYRDPYSFDDWDLERGSRVFVHLANSLVWEAITDQRPPSPPPTAAHYTRAGLPWFDYYDEDATPLDGARRLAELRSIIQMAREKGEVPLPENERVSGERVVRLRSPRPDTVREWIP